MLCIAIIAGYYKLLKYVALESFTCVSCLYLLQNGREADAVHVYRMSFSSSEAKTRI